MAKIPSREEIFTIIHFFQPLKVPGPDGLHPIFFHKYWKIVGNSIEKLCLETCSTSCIPLNINRTHVCLIPKKPNTLSLKDFRPISLCNTTYKIITKIIALRLKSLLNDIIGPYQSSFLQNRQISDNAIVAQELVSFLGKTKKEKTGHILLKSISQKLLTI